MDYAAVYDTLTNSIIIGGHDTNFSKKRELRRTIIHEIQHAIQELEGFATGSSYNPKSDTLYKKYIHTAQSLWGKFDHRLRWRINQILDAKDKGDIFRMQSWINALSDKDFAQYNAWAEAAEKTLARVDYLRSKYHRHSGETEARNAETRAYWSEKRRRSTPLDRSEDVARDEQIIGRLPRKAQTQSNSETYQQVIGYGAALRIDAQNGNHNLIDNLRVAQSMERRLKPNWTVNKYNSWERDYSSARKIWDATGWFRGADGQWKYEIPYGQIITDAFNNLKNNITKDANDNDIIENIKLSSIFDAPQLFDAYQSLRSLPVSFETMDDDTYGYLSEDKMALNIKLINNPDVVKNTIIHEIQHWIQKIEGFARGGNDHMLKWFKGTRAISYDGHRFNAGFFEANNYAREAQTILDSVSKEQQKVFRDLWDINKFLFTDKFNEDEYFRVFEKISQENMEKFNTWLVLMNNAEQAKNNESSYRYQEEAHSYLGGEVEARNTELRSQMSEEERRSSLPLDTQDTPSEQQFIFDHNVKPFSKNSYSKGFMTKQDVERFNQLHTHATRHIVLDNQFDLRYLHTGEGGNMFGAGIYLEENPDVAETYRTIGMSDNERIGTLRMQTVDGDEYVLTDYENVEWKNTNGKELTTPLREALNRYADCLLARIRNKLNLSHADIQQDVIDYYRNAIKEAKKKAKRKYDRDYQIIQIRRLQNALDYAYSFKEFKQEGQKKGNVYHVSLPENYELMDWDNTLDNQPEKVARILATIIDSINNNPAVFFAHHFSQFAKNPAKAEPKLTKIISDIITHYGIHSDNIGNTYRFRKLPEYKQLKRILHSDETIDDLRNFIARRGSITLDTHSNTGADLYHALTTLLGSKLDASMYLNSYGIPGHKYWDRLSRDKKSGTHNFVIWNTDTLRLLGLTDDSEQDAQDYYRAEDYSTAYLDSLDNDSDVIDYSDRDYDYDMEHVDDVANAHLDALDNDGFYETYKQSARDNSMDSNNTVRAVDDFLTPEARRQVEALRAKYQGTPQWLKAPNGKQSNLDELQWLLVRTPNFKQWFGDWEHDKEHASKILDNNGEPRIVYHGTPEGEFSVFKTGGGSSKTDNTGAWFTSNIQTAKTYFNNFEVNSLYPVFLNIRNPYIYNAGGRFWDELGTISIINRNNNTTITTDKNGNPFSSIQEAKDYIKHNFNGNERNYYTEITNPATTDQIVREVKSQNENFDGIIFKDIIDTGEGQSDDDDFYNEFTFEDDFIGDDFVVFLPNNIKSATRNNGEYSLSNNEIYKQSIGVIGAEAIDKANGNSTLMDKFNLAQEMARRKFKPRTIKRTTGWELGIEGKWKFELQDGQLRNPDAKHSLPLREFYDNEPLFAAYPKLNDINVVFDIERDLFAPVLFNPEKIGLFDRNTNTIHLQSFARNYLKYLPELPKNDYRHKKVKQIKEWLVSQIQRLIQPIEGFAPSRSSNWFAWKPRVVHKVDENGNLYPSIISRFPATAHENTAGETEARNAARRADFTPEQRRETLLKDTEDIDRKEQLIIQRDNINNLINDEGNALLDDDSGDGFNETYNQSARNSNSESNNTVRSVYDFLTPEAKRQVANLRRIYQNTPNWLKAPNGKKSYLTELQWLLVRTPNFKRWFGDWENNPTQASKVVDENGEPLIVLHQTTYDWGFSVFLTNGYDKTKGTGAWFADLKGQKPYLIDEEGVYVYRVFLNIRNPYIYDAQGKRWAELGTVWIADETGGSPIYYDKNNKPFVNKTHALDYIIHELHEEAILTTDDMGRKFYKPRYRVQYKESSYPTTDHLVRAVRKGKLGNGYNDGVIIRNVNDLGYFEPIDDYVIFKPIQVKSKNNNGAFSLTNTEIYKQSANLENNPLVETYRQVNPFSNPTSEAIYRRGMQPEKPKSAWQRIKQYWREIRKGFRGDFPLLAGQEAKDKGLTAAREILRIMNRNTDAKSHMVMVSLYDSLHGLNSEQFDIFSRLMLINDIYAFKKNNPNADLPMGFTPKTLKADKDYLVSLATKDKKILNALLTENENNKKARQDLVNLANELGFASLAKRLQSTDLFLIQYADILREAELGTNDFNTNYVIAISKMRTTMLQDLERLLAIKKLKEKGYDKKAELIRKYGNAKRGKIAEWKYHIPKGYSIFNPLSGQFISFAHSLAENCIGIAFEENCKNLGLSKDTISMLQTKFSDSISTQLMVLPDEITQTLSKLSTPNVHDPLYKFAKKLTNYWKKYVLYFPTRFWKYNLRNITGDLDAALAGDPTMIRFFPQAFSELTTAFYGDKSKISNELKEFQARGGALTFRSAQDLLEDRQLKKASKLIADLNAKGNSAWKNLPRNAWKLLDKFLGSSIQKLSDFREQWIRYAVYLDYLHQMQNNPDGMPNNWGASDKDEVMSIDDIRDRAFKMANELIGAYDQISETGRALRDLLIPFYSWMEVNAKRYLQLLYNGLAEEEIGDFAQRFLKGQIANIPYYTYKVGKTLLFISLFSILVQAFNNFFWPEDEKKLPPEIRERPHLVFGHDSEGNVRYFTNVGSLFDLVDWFGLDTFKHDIKQIFNGQQTVTDWIKHISSAPFKKLVNGLTPLIKTPLELGSGLGFYPDFTRPRRINDSLQYLAQSFGLTWPLKFTKSLVSGYSYSNWHEFRNFFIYSQDAEQAAYFYTLNLVNQFRENVLGEKFSGYSTNKRSQALRDFKTALRFNDKNAAVRSLQQYYSLDGTD